MTIWRTSLTFRDREGNERSASLCTSSATVVAELVAFAQGLEAALQPLSNARIVAATITTRWEYSPGPASQYSDVRRKGLLIARDFEEPSTYESILIPSPPYVPGSYVWRQGGQLQAWYSPLAEFNPGDPIESDRLRGRYVPLVFMNFSYRGAILALLDKMCRYDGTPFPANDFMYAELSQ